MRKLDMRTKEAIRYLGYGLHAVDQRTCSMITDSFQELEKIECARFVYRIFSLQTYEENRLQIEHMKIESKNLTKSLAGCEECVLLGATLGAEVDRTLRRYMITDVAKALVMQACAAARLEEYCDGKQERLREAFALEGKYLCPRFSPGYGDFSIFHQKDILTLLDAGKQLGVTVTDGMMLVPTKSITAVAGISKERKSCELTGCETCGKSDCNYRRSK